MAAIPVKWRHRLHRKVPLQFREYNMVIDEGANGTSTCAALVAATGFAESVNAQAASGAHPPHACCLPALPAAANVKHLVRMQRAHGCLPA